MGIRRWSLSIMGGTAAALAVASVSWACSNNGGLFPDADMVLANDDGSSVVTWNTGSNCGSSGTGEKGCNYSTVPLANYLATNGVGTAATATRDIDVNGTDFVNHDGTKHTSVGTVNLYWIDPPYFLTGLGGPGIGGERVAGEVCRTKGVLLNASPISVNNSGSFSTTVPGPPTAVTSVDNTPRKTQYGANAICAVWFHNPDGITGNTDDHYAGVGNQYTLYPL